jgi:hypothetical protein
MRSAISQSASFQPTMSATAAYHSETMPRWCAAASQPPAPAPAASTGAADGKAALRSTGGVARQRRALPARAQREKREARATRLRAASSTSSSDSRPSGHNTQPSRLFHPAAAAGLGRCTVGSTAAGAASSSRASGAPARSFMAWRAATARAAPQRGRSSRAKSAKIPTSQGGEGRSLTSTLFADVARAALSAALRARAACVRRLRRGSAGCDALLAAGRHGPRAAPCSAGAGAAPSGGVAVQQEGRRGDADGCEL